MELNTAAPVSLEQLTKRFGTMTAVDSLTMQIPTGKLVCLLGPSGCGKTTTLRMIGGFEEPTSGTIRIGDRVVNRLPPYRRPTAMVFQSYALFPHMTVFDNVAYGLRCHRVPGKEIPERVSKILEAMEISALAPKYPRQLSGGQQQRVALARALVIEPQVLLLDEPLSNLDAALRVRVRTEIRALQRRLGITAVYVTHDQEEAFSLSDVTAIMHQGQLVQFGAPAELYRRPVSRFVAQFVGLSNIVPAKVLGREGAGMALSVFGRPVHAEQAPAELPGQAYVVLRPEMLRLSRCSGEGVPARVLNVSYLGPMARYRAALEGDQVLIVDLHNPGESDLYSEGEAVTLTLPNAVPGLLLE